MEFALPKELSSMLELFLEKGHDMACADTEMVFTKYTNGEGETFQQAAHFTNYWHKLMKHIGCTAHISPHRLAYFDTYTHTSFIAAGLVPLS